VTAKRVADDHGCWVRNNHGSGSSSATTAWWR
jgi:hypothetical protein